MLEPRETDAPAGKGWDQLERQLAEGRQYLSARLPRQAAAHFTRAWHVAAQCDPRAASLAAWHVACALIQLEAYGDALPWIERIADTSPDEWALVLANRQALEQMCRRLGERRPAQPRAHAAPAEATPGAEGWIPALKVTSLGSFQITRGSVPLPTCRSRKSSGVFRYLLTRKGHSAHREEIVEQLWPASDPARAFHSLHVAVSSLRRHLDTQVGSYLIYDAGHYVLNPAIPIDEDRERFSWLCELAERERLAGDLSAAARIYCAALEHYAGDYVVDDRDGTWALLEREQLQTRYLSALEYAGRIAVVQHAYEAAAQNFQQLLSRDSLREDVHYELMGCYLRLGRRAEALQQYETCAAVLQAEMGIAPLPKLTELYRQAQRGEASTESVAPQL